MAICFGVEGYEVWGEGLTLGLHITPWIGKWPFKLTASLLERATAIFAGTLVVQLWHATVSTTNCQYHNFC